MNERKRISIISPCFNERDAVEHCAEAVRDVMTNRLPQYDYEHIFADNSSTDGTRDVLRAIASTDRRIKVIMNARNYGPFRSSFNALRAATGDAVLVMLPVDLQDPPQMLPQFVDEWVAGYKIVYGQRQEREEGIVFRLVRKLYYRLVRSLSEFDLPIDTAEFQLLDRQIVDALLRFNDHYPYIRGMIANVGFREQSKALSYRWQSRKVGRSKNRLFHLIDQGLNGLISFSNVPLRIASLIGLGVALTAILYALLQFLLNLVVRGITAPGVPTLIVALFFFSGVQLLFIGLLGEYVSSIHAQVRQGPIVIERERINFDDPPTSHTTRVP
jgi:glycosyltransferase involved in cell wall biosynthesis